MASDRVPRGMTALGVRHSEDVVEKLAEAYVYMDLTTMAAFHKKAMAAMMQGGANPAAPGEVNYDEQMLQAMGGGGGGGVATPMSAAAGGAAAASAPPSAGSSAADGAAAPPGKKAPEKTAFDVTLKKFPAENKIKLIKELRAVCGLGIQEAKSAIEKCPGVIARQVQKADAEKLKGLMVKLGAEVELL